MNEGPDDHDDDHFCYNLTMSPLMIVNTSTIFLPILPNRRNICVLQAVNKVGQWIGREGFLEVRRTSNLDQQVHQNMDGEEDPESEEVFSEGVVGVFQVVRATVIRVVVSAQVIPVHRLRLVQVHQVKVDWWWFGSL